MLIDQQVQVGKELQDCFAALTLIVKDIKAGKSVLEIGADALPALISAVGGIGDVPAEVAVRKAALVTAALGVSDLMDALGI